MEDQELLGLAEAARLLNVSVTSLRRWTNDGRLACVRVGPKRERRFRRRDLERFLEEQPSAAGAVHRCGLYDTPASRATQAAQFLADGARHGAHCFLGGMPDMREAVLAQLRRHSAGALLDEGRLVLLEYRDNPAEQLAAWDQRYGQAMAAGARRLCTVGDVSGGALARAQPDEVLEQYERDYDRLYRHLPLSTLCQYDARRCSGRLLFGMLRIHRDDRQRPGAYPVL